MIFAVIGAGIGTGFIPMYSRIKYEQGPSAADRFTSNLISIVLAICTVIAVWGLVFTKPLVRLFASGFHGETLKMTVQFTRISIFAIYFTGLTGIITGYPQTPWELSYPQRDRVANELHCNSVCGA